MADSLFLIDSRFLLETSHNTFHGAPLLQDSRGRDTTMLFGFARDLLRLRKQLGMRKALILFGNAGSCLPGSLASDAIEFVKRLCVPSPLREGRPRGRCLCCSGGALHLDSNRGQSAASAYQRSVWCHSPKEWQ